MSLTQAQTTASIQSVLSLISENEIQIVDIRFTDMSGVWHHMSFPVAQVDENFLRDGFCVDGSSGHAGGKLKINTVGKNNE